jgi:hypothetical protein
MKQFDTLIFVIDIDFKETIRYATRKKNYSQVKTLVIIGKNNR